MDLKGCEAEKNLRAAPVIVKVDAGDSVSERAAAAERANE